MHMLTLKDDMVTTAFYDGSEGTRENEVGYEIKMFYDCISITL